ncbi:MAG: ABC transporter permease [Eubacteriales bacterium]
MYKLLTPFRSIFRNFSRYLIFALLLLLLLALNTVVRTVGDAAETECSSITERYASTFLFYDLQRPHGNAEDIENVLRQLPHVARAELQAMHTLNSVLGIRLFGISAQALDAHPLVGRLYENETECCINESYAQYLQSAMGFSGVGDSITVRDDDNARQYTVKRLEDGSSEYSYFPREKSAEFTVVGILPDSDTLYSRTLTYGRYRIYTTVEAAAAFYEGIEDNLYFSRYADPVASQNWLPKKDLDSFILTIDQGAMRPSDDGTHWVFLDPYTQTELLLADAEFIIGQYPPNEGFTALVTIDDPSNQKEFLSCARAAFTGISDIAQRYLDAGVTTLGTIPLVRTLSVGGEERMWYQRIACQQFWYAAHLIDDPESLVSSLAPVSPLCDAIGRAASAASAVLILLMTILVVHERRYEIGVLRCIGVSACGVCARFIAEISVFLAIVSAAGVALGIPAAHLAAKLLGVADSVSGVLPAALLLLAGIAAVTVLSCLAASAMILAKKPMHILNSRT